MTRASVTIVFNNKDKKGSPVGYEAYDEITVCRQVPTAPPSPTRPPPCPPPLHPPTMDATRPAGHTPSKCFATRTVSRAAELPPPTTLGCWEAAATEPRWVKHSAMDSVMLPSGVQTARSQ